MLLGNFEINEPVPNLRNPHLMVVLKPWIDVGSVGTLALETLERHLGAENLGGLARPGEFYDFTRYRPTIRRFDGERQITLPNSDLWWARGQGDFDWIFLHLLEPHIKSEDLLDSIVAVMQHFGVKRYALVGAMYGTGPHTRPLLASGSSTDPEIQQLMEPIGMGVSTYEGPTSVMALATEEARKLGVESMSLLIQLPPYARLDEDHKGHEARLRYLGMLYDWNLDLSEIKRDGERQYSEVEKATQADRQMRGVVRRLEEAYDAGDLRGLDEDEEADYDSAELPMAVEDFLKDLEDRDDD